MKKIINYLKNNYCKLGYRLFFGLFMIEILVIRDLNNSENLFLLGAIFLMFDRLKPK